MSTLAKPPPRFARLPALAPPGRHYLVIGWWAWGAAKRLSHAIAAARLSDSEFDPAVDRCLIYHAAPAATVDAEGWIVTPPETAPAVLVAEFEAVDKPEN